MTLSISAFLALAAVAAAPPQDDGGAGLRLEQSLLVEGLGNVAGGARTGGAAHVLARAGVLLDGAALLGVEGLRGHITGLVAYGNGASALAGDLQGASNIAAPDQVWLYEAWIQRNLGPLSILAGLYDVNSEFDVLGTAALLLNSSFGSGAELAASGPNGPSAFPATGLAVRASGALNRRVRFQAAVADGTPWDPTRPRRFAMGWRPGDGALLVGEAVRLFDGVEDGAGAVPTSRRFMGRGAEEPAGKVGLGLWGYTGVARDRLPEPHWGGYVLWETRIRARGADIGVFGRAGVAEGPFRGYLGLGGTSGGAVPGRPDDALGAGLAVAWPERSLGAGSAPETVIELSYKLRMPGDFFIQPDLQYILNPLNAAADDAVVVILRLGWVP